MPLYLVPPPPAVLETYEGSLADFLDEWEPPALLYHIPVGSMGLPELAGGAGLADVAPSGCRILGSWASGLQASSEMTNPTLYGQAKFRNFIKGEMVAVQFGRIAEAMGLERVRNEDFDLHFLSIPGVYLEALHLVCRGTNDDVILPVLSCDPQLGSDLVLDGKDFVARARSIAAARLAMPASSDLSS